jgi:hypothetical protein
VAVDTHGSDRSNSQKLVACLKKKPLEMKPEIILDVIAALFLCGSHRAAEVTTQSHSCL